MKWSERSKRNVYLWSKLEKTNDKRIECGLSFVVIGLDANGMIAAQQHTSTKQTGFFNCRLVIVFLSIRFPMRVNQTRTDKYDLPRHGADSSTAHSLHEICCCCSEFCHLTPLIRYHRIHHFCSASWLLVLRTTSHTHRTKHTRIHLNIVSHLEHSKATKRIQRNCINREQCGFVQCSLCLMFVRCTAVD